MFPKKLQTLNSYFTSFGIPRKFLFVIGMVMFLQVLAETFSASLLIPFINSFREVDGLAAQSNRYFDFVNNLFVDKTPEQRFLYVLFSMLCLMSAAQFAIILIDRLILKFTIFTVQKKVSHSLFEKILNARLKFYYSKRSGDLIHNLITDVYKSFNCVNKFLLMSNHIIFVLGYIVVGLLILPKYMIGLLSFMLIFYLIFKKLMPFIYNLGSINVKSLSNVNNIVVESIQGLRNVHLSCAEKSVMDKFKAVMNKFYHTDFDSIWITRSIPTFMRFCAIIAILFVLYMNRELVVAGEGMFFSKLIFFIFVTANLFKYFGSIQSSYSAFNFTLKGMENVLELHRDVEQYKPLPRENLTKIDTFKNAIDIKDLDFAYLNDIKVLKGLNVHIEKNQKVAFVGKSGSGKSTLVDVISGFHPDYEGSILIDGVELKDLNPTDWRHLIGYVSQETFVFNDTVMNNLKFGFETEISDEEIKDACAKAQFLDTIEAFENGFETMLGERGVKLSGGEKQRLAIARLFLKKPEIVLLDEATSSLDSESEKKVKDALEALGEGRTVIAVAHRLSTIADYNQICVLESGKIVEKGTHNELIDLSGYYFKYYSIQSMDEVENVA